MLQKNKGIYILPNLFTSVSLFCGFYAVVASILILLIIAYKPRILLFLIVSIYILSGPAAKLYSHYRKRRAGRGYAEISGKNHDPETFKTGDFQGA